MRNTFHFKPVGAKLTHDTEFIGRMDPYCKFIIGDMEAASQVCQKGGKTPSWTDTVTLHVPASERMLRIDVMDKDKFSKDDLIGTTTVNLDEIVDLGRVEKWYPLYFKDKSAGELLMIGILEGGLHKQQESTIMLEEFNAAGKMASGTFKHKEVDMMKNPAQMVVEHRQHVDPQVFTKEVEVVETRPHTREIEVLEPVKVMKDIEYTEAVPVTKKIEVVEPVVVTKEIEVLEPRVITKTIQVVEEVPVMKEVEVVEMKTEVKEVETVELQTKTKKVEVTEQVPRMKEFVVTEPVTVKKTVDYVQPVVTTKTITKEVMEPIVVEEKIETHVEPATLLKDVVVEKSMDDDRNPQRGGKMSVDKRISSVEL